MRGKMDVMDTLGLYLSVPFCKAKCTFCNFASDAFPPERMAAYVDRLCAEIADARSFAERGRLRLPSRVDSIFVGGGTPSLLEPEQMRRLFATVRAQFAVDADAEITVEAAPGQIAGDLLDAMLAGGVNRVSLGVQSFVDAEARAVGRSHTGVSCLGELERLRSAGIVNLNVDLIAGLPHQTTASWTDSLEQAIGSGAEHVSIYMLEVDEDSRLGRELIGPGVRYGAHAAPGESMVADLYTQACEALDAAGLQQYEISNFARTGFRSLHNCKYWTRAPYFGFGLDAHSMLHDQRGHAVRFSNGDELTPYVAGDELRQLESINELAAWEETIFLGLRLVEGISIAELRKGHSAARIEALLDTAKDLSGSDFMRVSSDSVSLTQQGRILSSSIFGELLAVPAA
jgi:oxygen-independent coproporphyrinogen-3 oxidase